MPSLTVKGIKRVRKQNSAAKEHHARRDDLSHVRMP
jgi:hypothetical protein